MLNMELPGGKAEYSEDKVATKDMQRAGVTEEANTLLWRQIKGAAEGRGLFSH